VLLCLWTLNILLFQTKYGLELDLLASTVDKMALSSETGRIGALPTLHLRGWKQIQVLKCVKFGILDDGQNPDTQ
jgi:hypothetical protein